MAADASPSFLLLDPLPAVGEEMRLLGDEAHYLSRVVRARPGERATATDGRGGIAAIEVIESRPAAIVRGLSREQRERSGQLTLWCGAPEGDRADWLVEKAAELGVAHLQLVDLERARWDRAATRLERWERLAISALRQSRSAHRMSIGMPRGLEDLLEEAGEGLRVLALPGGSAWPEGNPAEAVTAAVGPSPGFSEPEVKRLRDNGFVVVALAGSRLRTETAAMALASIWAARLATFSV